jgi:spermidine synthase
MRLALAALGFTATIAQVVLMRELVATFYGNELLFGLALAAWLAWTAVGARVGAGLGNRKGHPYAAGLAATGVLLLAQLALVRGVRVLLGVTPGAFVELAPMVVAVVLVLAPLCLLGGCLFTLGARLMIGQGGTASQAYAWESTGAVTGGLLFSFLLVQWFDPFQTALLIAAANLAVAAKLYPMPHASRVTHYASRLLLLASCILLLASFPLGRLFHTATLGWQWPDLAFAADSPYGRLTIQARDGQRAFFENGLLAFETQGTFPEEVVHFPLLAHPDPREVLLIGGGIAGDVREVLKHPNARVTYVELDPLLIEAARAYLPPEDAAVLDDPRVTLVLTDGRLYVQGATHTFDAIILDLPEPATGALNRFYTREFFAEARAILSPGGVFALGLPAAENYWSPEMARRNASVYWTLRDAFPQVVALPGEHVFFLASDIPLATDPTVLVERLDERGITTRWVTPEYIRYVYTTDRFASVRAELEGMADVRRNRDLAPICYYYDLALWLSRFYPAAGSEQVPNLRGAFERAGLVNLGWVAAPLAALVLLARWRRRMVVPLAVACAGLAGMTLEVIVLFAFQVLHGTLYARISLIVAASMAGLAVGSTVGNRVMPPLLSPPQAGGKSARRMLLAVLLAITLYSGLLLLILPLSIPAPIFLLLAVAGGALAGMAFPLAMALTPGDAGHTAGRLYAADLAGSFLGALTGTAFLVPLLGLPQTCIAVALVGLAGLLMLV